MKRPKSERDLILTKMRTAIKPLHLVESAADIAQMAVEKERQAFGGCILCYGKGYATTMEFETRSADFVGDRSVTRMLSLVRYCRCDRGKQLRQLAQAGAFLPSNRSKLRR